MYNSQKIRRSISKCNLSGQKRNLNVNHNRTRPSVLRLVLNFNLASLFIGYKVNCPNRGSVFAGWTREYLLVHCCVLQIFCIPGTTLYPVSRRTLSFPQFQPWMSINLNRSPLVLLPISNVPVVVSCLPRSVSLDRAEHASQQPLRPLNSAAKGVAIAPQPAPPGVCQPPQTVGPDPSMCA